MNRAFVERLEDRRHFAVTPAPATPYNTYNNLLTGEFTSAVPLVVIGGQDINVALRVRNTTRQAQRGLIDLTFVLDLFVRGTAPVADRFDPVILRRENVMMSLAPRGSQTFRFTGTLPVGVDVPAGEYFVAVSVDPGGSIAAGQGYGATIGAAVTTYRPPFTDVTAAFNISLRRRSGLVSGSISASILNFGNAAATGPVTLRIFTATSATDTSSATPVTLQTVTLTGLRVGGRTRTVIPFDAPTNLPVGVYFIRIEVDRSGLPFDTDFAGNRNVFSRRPVTLQ